MSRARLGASRPRRLTRRAGLILAISIAALGALAGTGLADGWWFGGSANDNPWPYNHAQRSPTLAAVGDIACQPDTNTSNQTTGEKPSDFCSGGTNATERNAAQNATAMQVEGMHPSLVAVLGDEQYQNGYYQDFEQSYDKYWGAFKFLQRPSPGNHEFYDNHGQNGVRGVGYFDYFNGIQHDAGGNEVDTTVGKGVTQPAPQPSGQAGQYGTSGDGWYSYDLGTWHIISLNIECKFQSAAPGATNGCTPAGPWLQSETQWLAHDLQGDHQACTLAYWHQPLYSSTSGTPATATSPAGNWMQDSAEGEASQAWWKLLYAHHADLILNGHDHVYSRFAPLDPNGNPDPRHGIREFIVGTGGEALDQVVPSTPNLEAWSDQYYGAMQLALHPHGYSWDYASALKDPGAADTANPSPAYSDSGSGSCHGGSDGADG